MPDKRTGKIHVEFYRHELGEKELENIRRVFSTPFLTTGPETAAFESAFKKLFGAAEAVGVSSCTAALILSLVGLGIGEGDEVITTPMTYVATLNAILHANATPVLVDVDPETGNIDAATAEKAITSKTKILMPVHLYGLMCDMKAFRSLADAHNLVLVEDSAHCIEGSRDGVLPGQLSDAACFSYYATKNMTAGEGGAVITNNLELAERIRRLRNQGIDRDASSRHNKPAHVDQIELGYKAGMSDIQAAILNGQLVALESRHRKRLERATRYDEAFRPIDEIGTMICPSNAVHARHLYTIHVDPARRDSILAALQNCGIGATVNYRPAHLHTYMQKRLGYGLEDFPNAEKIGASTISLPLYPGLKLDEQNYVISKVIELCQKG